MQPAVVCIPYKLPRSRALHTSHMRPMQWQQRTTGWSIVTHRAPHSVDSHLQVAGVLLLLYHFQLDCTSRERRKASVGEFLTQGSSAAQLEPKQVTMMWHALFTARSQQPLCTATVNRHSAQLHGLLVTLQATPTSSACVQPCCPQPLCLHWSSRRSLPVHSTLDIHIGWLALPGPSLRCTAMAGSGSPICRHATSASLFPMPHTCTRGQGKAVTSRQSCRCSIKRDKNLHLILSQTQWHSFYSVPTHRAPLLRKQHLQPAHVGTLGAVHQLQLDGCIVADDAHIFRVQAAGGER